MIAVDTNVLLRHLLDDDRVQSPLAHEFFSRRSPQDPAFIGRLVLAETVWTLVRHERVDRSRVSTVIRSLLAAADVHVEDHPAVWRALQDAEDAGADIADALIAHAAIDAGCDGVVTFDRRALELPGMLPVG